MNAVGGHIRKLRKRDNMTQQALADRLNVTRQAVSQWENGNTQPDLDTLAAIAGVFGVDMMEVIYGEKRKETSGIDPEQRKRYLTGLIVFGLLTVVMLALELFLRPYLVHTAYSDYRCDMILYYGYYTAPLLYLFIPLATLNLCSLVWDIRIKYRYIRIILMVITIVYLLFHYGAGIIYLRQCDDMPQLVFDYFFKDFKLIFFLLPGIGLFLGLNGRRTGRELGCRR